MIIGLAGPAGAGKSTIAKAIAWEDDWFIDSFASPLYEAIKALGYDNHNKEAACDRLNGLSPRETLQRLGDFYKSVFGKDIFVERLLRDATEANSLYGQDTVIDDCRYDVEAYAIMQAGGQVFRLTGRSKGPVREHSSEEGLTLPGVIDIDNSGDISDTVREILSYL